MIQNNCPQDVPFVNDQFLGVENSKKFVKCC